ncbi:MAG: InlB B-repeat-containing protein, partial [Clostridia bacterium]|nr:InlB B-repeat-containing protein [Clostridia bacterium]
MKRIAKRLAIVLCFIVCAVMLISVPLSACGSTGRVGDTHKVVFLCDELPADVQKTVENMPQDQEVEEGGYATEPEETPTADGYTFQYWYQGSAENENKTRFDFAGTPITEKVYIEGHWTKDAAPSEPEEPEEPEEPGQDTYYTVTFDLGNAGSASVIASQSVLSGGTATKPSSDPVADGYTFDGWYADSSFTTVFDFSTAITANTTIYAKWTAVSSDEPVTTSIAVTYSTGVLNANMAQNMPNDQTVSVGSKVTKPTATPTMTGYTFSGWYTEAVGGTKYQFTDALTETSGENGTLTLYAHWMNKEDTVTVAAVGDSLTAPQTWSNYHPYSYYLQEDLDAIDSGVYDVQNYGVSGATVTQLLDTTSLPRQYIEVSDIYGSGTGGYPASIKAEPDIVIIMLGTNDAQYKSATQCWDAVSSLTYKDDLEELITSYQDIGSQVILVTSPHLFEQTTDGTALYTADVREEDVLKVNEVQREVADEMGLYLMDFHSYMESLDDQGYSYVRYNNTESFSTGGYPGDGLHFNTTGTAALASYLTSAVENVACMSETGTDDTNPVDVVLFGGQSNMAGRGDISNYSSDSSIITGVEEGHGYAYNAISAPNTLSQITEPFGQNENGTGSGYMSESSKSGSVVSSFVESYYSVTNVPIVAVSASRGGAPIAAWTKGGATCTVSNTPGTYCNYYADTLERLESAVNYVSSDSCEFTIRNIFIVWLQGETDGDNGTTADSYKSQLNDLYNNLNTDLTADTSYSLDHLYVIPIGTYEGDNDTLKTAYNTIRQAQIEFCAYYDYADVLTLGMQDLTSASQYLRSDGYYVHVLQPGLQILGTNAGMNMGRYVIGKNVVPQRYNVDTGVWYTPGTQTTINVGDADGRITVGEWENVQTVGDVLSLPSNYDVTTNNGKTLIGWYYTVDGGATYTKVTDSTTVVENMTLVPYFYEDHENVATNNATGNTGYVNDGGTSAGTTVTNYWQNFPTETVLNTDTYTEETIITYTGTAALDNLNWFRLNTYYNDVSVSVGNTYNLYYNLTNYGSETLTFTIYFCTNGWIWSTSSGYVPTQSEYAQVTLSPGETKLVVIDNFELEVVNSNFITCIVIGTHTDEKNTDGSYSITDFQLGITTGIYESTTVTLSGIEDATVSSDYLSGSGAAAYDAENGVLSIDKGASIELPEGEYLTAPEGYEFGGWYTDADCTVKVTEASLTDITEATTFYAKWNQIAVITLALDSVENISFTDAGTTTYNAYVGDNLQSIIESADFISLYTLSTEGGSSYSITGWYIMAGDSIDANSDTLITSTTTITGTAITIYPVVEENDATITIETNDGISSITTSVGAKAESNLLSTLTQMVNGGQISVTFSDNENNNAYISGWEIKGSTDDSWTAATDTDTITSDMTVRPVVSYIVITITFEADDSQILSYTSSSTSFTIYAEGEYTVSGSGIEYSYDDTYYDLTNWTVTRSNDNGSTWMEVGTYGSSEAFDIEDGYTYKLVPNLTKTRTEVAVNNAGGLITMSEGWANSVQTIGEALVVPTASNYTLNTDRSLEGWYYTTDNSTYTKVTSTTEVADGMTVVPYFTSDVYNLTTNDADSYTDYVHDAGTTFGSTTSNYYTNFTLGYGLNSTDYTENLVVTWAGTGSISDGYWFRLLTYYTNQNTNITIGYYNLFYELTNYSDTEITITIYFMGTGQPGNSSSNNYMGGYATVTIPAGGSVSVILANAHYLGTASGAAPN